MARGGSTGPATDAVGLPVIDPTENVKALNEAGLERQDDLRNETQKGLRREMRWIREEMRLRSMYEAELRSKESERLDAIRQRDNEQVTNASEVQRGVATTLAATVDRSAEAMRSSQAVAASTIATTLDAKIAPLTSAIGDLQRFQFESGGAKQQTVEARTEQRGGSANIGMWIGIAVAALIGLSGMFVSMLGIAVTAYLALRPR